MRREGSAPAARQSHVREVLAAEHISREPAKIEIASNPFGLDLLSALVKFDKI